MIGIDEDQFIAGSIAGILGFAALVVVASTVAVMAFRRVSPARSRQMSLGTAMAVFPALAYGVVYLNALFAVGAVLTLWLAYRVGTTERRRNA